MWLRLRLRLCGRARIRVRVRVRVGVRVRVHSPVIRLRLYGVGSLLQCPAPLFVELQGGSIARGWAVATAGATTSGPLVGNLLAASHLRKIS